MRRLRPKEKALLAATAAVAASILLSGCSGGGKRDTAPPACEGPLVPMNADHWTPTAEQAAEMARLAQEVCK